MKKGVIIAIGVGILVAIGAFTRKTGEQKPQDMVSPTPSPTVSVSVSPTASPIPPTTSELESEAALLDAELKASEKDSNFEFSQIEKEEQF